jgi:Trypsin
MIGVVVLLASGAALAITNGTPDGKLVDPEKGIYEYPKDGSYTYKYPQVGALLDPKGLGDGTYTYCTGTLISPTVFLTAAHCDALTGEAVTFDAKYVAGSTVYKICKGPDCTEEKAGGQFDGKFKADPNGYDIAVVVFFDPPFGDPPKLDNGTPDVLTDDTPITLAQLPKYHQFNDAAKGSKFTAVGYGGYKADSQSGGSSSVAYDDVRRYAVSTLKSVNQDYLRLSQNQGSGGTCYGDSGGPNFVGDVNETNVIASITSTGDTWCNSTNVTLRLDTEVARTFLSRTFLDGEGVTVPPKP